MPKKLLIILVGFAFHCIALAQEQEISNPISEFYDCAQGYGKLVSHGNATATEISEAAIWSCREYRSKVSDYIKARLKRDVPGATVADVREYAKTSEETLVITAKQAAIYAVVNARTLPRLRK